eukprot:2925473-Rhodomonas_salina.2
MKRTAWVGREGPRNRSGREGDEAKHTSPHLQMKRVHLPSQTSTQHPHAPPPFASIAMTHDVPTECEFFDT